ncbi:MAG: 4Fe-4S binding protein, partial [Caldilineaceae bacterium]
MSYEGYAGRTLIARNLFQAAVLHSSAPVQLACFDIEKPDLIQLMAVQDLDQEEIVASQPVIDISKCRYCGACVGYCPEQALQFNRFVPSVTLIVSRCFGCGECLRGCTRDGLKMKEKAVGKIVKGKLNGHWFIGGQLEKGCELKVPLVKALLDRLNVQATVVCDFGPGDGRAVSAGLSGMDFAVVVVEPEAEWKRNLETMCLLLEKCSVPFGVILNKVKGDSEFGNEANAYCSKHDFAEFGLIPYESCFECQSDLENRDTVEVMK